MTARTDMPHRPSRLIVMGYKRHGKDASCEYVEDRFGLSFKASSYFACETFLFDQMRESHGYASIDECFDDRVNHREYWYNAIRDYNKDDRCRLGRGIFESHPIYCGIRDREEFEALRAEGLFDLAIWIDASERLPPEDASSMNLSQADADIVVRNNGTLKQLHQNLDNLFAMLGFTPIYEDGEVLGIDADGGVILWNIETLAGENIGEGLEEFGTHNLRPRERARLGLDR